VRVLPTVPAFFRPLTLFFDNELGLEKLLLDRLPLGVERAGVLLKLRAPLKTYKKRYNRLKIS
jgi:hypothetical protein